MGLTKIRIVVVALGTLLVLVACGEPSDPKVMFETGNYEGAYKRFQELAAAGDMEATNYLGIHYYVGAAVERDFLAAARWFETAALAGHAGAQKNLGMMYFRGLGVEVDNQKAFGWLYHAKQSGNKEAQKYLKQMQTKVTPNASVIAVDVVSKQLASKESALDPE